MYLGSFNDKPIRADLNPLGKELFEKEQTDLLNDLFEIPQRSCDRKVGAPVAPGSGSDSTALPGAWTELSELRVLGDSVSQSMADAGCGGR